MAIENRHDGVRASEKKTVVRQIIEYMQKQIIKGYYKPGMKIPNEYELISELQVSRNSLREAIKILTTMGIMEIRRGDGTYVCSQLNQSTFDTIVYSVISKLSSNTELLELREVLDDATVRMAIRKTSPDDVAQLKENVQSMAEAVKKGQYELAQEMDYQFHMSLIDSCHNIFFGYILKGVYSIFQSSIGETVKLEKIDSKAPQYHQRIIDCIETKDFEHVHEVVEDSLQSWQKLI
ncbi:FadR family transcriptional regulator [Caproiciproducens sp. NJN-50]|uniref:FadR/GntR family transcriptional regulator n=1 Tax=Acutalibacteraceae TaxID=3082771 RepID=UPI000FFE09FF|nr:MULTISPECIES: FCD domain-containing protein [Acutalibacteraceae]QAT50290.1 FadR family transcriptional regulator [Caproiciproducens sp. NJN-50]